MADRRAEVLVALQQALLCEVTSPLRAITVTYDETSIAFDAYYDGEISDDAKEAMNRVETELWASFPDTHTIAHSVKRLDWPGPIPKDYIWVYCRQEPTSDA